MEHNMSMEKIYNVETKKTTEVPLSDEAVAQLSVAQAKIEAENLALSQKLKARQAVLDKLGLTADEAVLLLS
jgi:hypothetical protein